MTLPANEILSLPKGQIICGDCLEILPSLPDACVDAVITDPPYAISSDSVIKRRGTKFEAKDIVLNFGDWDIFETDAEYLDFTCQWSAECHRVLKPGGTFISYFDKKRVHILTSFLLAHGYRLRNLYADCKTNPVPQVRKVNWMSGWELLAILQQLAAISQLQPDEHATLERFAVAVGDAVLSYWSVDFAQDKHGGWWLIDMALGEVSYDSRREAPQVDPEAAGRFERYLVEGEFPR